MSFDYNPYKHIDIVQDDDGEWGIYCSSCGMEKYMFDENATIADLISVQGLHLLNSHKRSPESFASWSTT
jgi:hypothetical protein